MECAGFARRSDYPNELARRMIMRREFAAVLAGAVIAVVVIYALFDDRVHVRSLISAADQIVPSHN